MGGLVKGSERKRSFFIRPSFKLAKPRHTAGDGERQRGKEKR